jgi:hypothetical protein
MFVFGVLAFFLLAATLFCFLSDDFVIRGQIVSGTDSKVSVWRVCASLGSTVSGGLAWFFYHRSRR